MKDERSIPDKSIRNTLRPQEAAEYLGISYGQVQAMARRREIPFTPAGKIRLFRKDTLDKWMDEKERESLRKDHEDSGFGTLRKIY